MRTIESVWDYPRPPGVKPRDEPVVWPVLETSRAPVYYVPFDAVTPGSPRW